MPQLYISWALWLAPKQHSPSTWRRKGCALLIRGLKLHAGLVHLHFAFAFLVVHLGFAIGGFHLLFFRVGFHLGGVALHGHTLGKGRRHGTEQESREDGGEQCFFHDERSERMG